MNRNPSPLSLRLIEAMSTDPNSTPALRKFHAQQLAELRASVKPERTARPSPFSRFAESLERDTLTCTWCHDTAVIVRPGEEPADAADRAHWYDGSVCPSCAPAARDADDADDWVSEGRP